MPEVDHEFRVCLSIVKHSKDGLPKLVDASPSAAGDSIRTCWWKSHAWMPYCQPAQGYSAQKHGLGVMHKVWL